MTGACRICGHLLEAKAAPEVSDLETRKGIEYRGLSVAASVHLMQYHRKAVEPVALLFGAVSNWVALAALEVRLSDAEGARLAEEYRQALVSMLGVVEYSALERSLKIGLPENTLNQVKA